MNLKNHITNAGIIQYCLQLGKKFYALFFPIVFFSGFNNCGYGQNKKVYQPAVQACNCNFKLDSSYYATVPAGLKADSSFICTIESSFQKFCGYLIVPENRNKVSSRMIKLPVIVLKSKNQNKKKDPFLFTTGGPGGSSLSWINGMAKSTIIESRDCITLEQRGTHFAIPNLRSFELDTAIRESYRKNLNKDSMWLEGVKRYKKKLVKKGIDLSGYNTNETVDDIIDLLKVLQIDSVNLSGASYSAMAMLEVLQKAPSKVRSVILDSPLPNFIRIEEDEPMNFGEMDPACRPVYMYMIKHYMPNAQCFLFLNKSHGVGGSTFKLMTQKFLDDPYGKIEILNDKIVAY